VCGSRILQGAGAWTERCGRQMMDESTDFFSFLFSPSTVTMLDGLVPEILRSPGRNEFGLIGISTVAYTKQNESNGLAPLGVNQIYPLVLTRAQLVGGGP